MMHQLTLLLVMLGYMGRVFHSMLKLSSLLEKLSPDCHPMSTGYDYSKVDAVVVFDQQDEE